MCPFRASPRGARSERSYAKPIVRDKPCASSHPEDFDPCCLIFRVTAGVRRRVALSLLAPSRRVSELAGGGKTKGILLLNAWRWATKAPRRPMCGWFATAV